MDLRHLAFDAKLQTVRRRSLALYRELERNQHLDPTELAELEAHKAGEIAAFAGGAAPFYRELYAQHGLGQVELRQADRWTSIPIVDRSMVKAHRSELLTPEATDRNSRDALTGGSTGEPLRVRHDKRVPLLAASWRMYGWWGVAPYDNIARVARWDFTRRAELKNDLQWFPTKQIYLDAALISTETMETFHRRLVRTRPALLEGYAGAMLEFADFVEKRRLSVPTLTAVATTAAPLTESIRNRLQTVLGAPVHDEYRGAELSWMAGECSQRNGLHLFSDLRRFEVVSSDGKVLPHGEVGDLVVTDLTNRAFPLIRYRIGDRGRLLDGPCACGVTLPRMAQPEGRTTDLLRLPSGAVLGHRLMALFSAEPDAVRLFQIHQQADHSIVLRVVLGEGADAAVHVERAAQELRQRIAHEVPVTVEYVAALPYTGGKTKYVISDVVAS